MKLKARKPQTAIMDGRLVRVGNVKLKAKRKVSLKRPSR